MFFALACSFIDAQNISLTKEKRTLAVQQMYARIREPERVRRRRLGEALEEENIMDILEAFEYHLELSKQSLMLRSIGVKEEDGLPATMNDTAMTSGLGDAMKSLSMHLMHEEEHASARRLKERKRRLSQEKYDKIHHILRKTSAAVYEEPIRKPAKPRYLGEISEGVHEIDISGGAVRSSRNGRKLADGALTFGGTCTEKPMGPVYEDGWTSDGVVDKDCTCDTNGIQDAGSLALTGVTLKFKGRWCKCTSGDYYSNVGWDCANTYPSIATGSTCTVDTSAFPKSIACKYILVFAKGFWITVGTNLDIGYGSSGKSDDMMAQFSFGVMTNQLPRPGYCDDPPTGINQDNAVSKLTSAITNILLCGDKVWYILEIMGAMVQGVFDVGKNLGGDAMADTVKYFPLQMKFPKTYDGSKDKTKMKFLAQIPLKAVSAANAGSSSVDGLDFGKSGGVCLSELGGKLKMGGGLKRLLKFTGVALAMAGADVCLEMPDLAPSGADLLFGLKFNGKAFDQTDVSLIKFVDLLPDAWEQMATDITGTGLRTLLRNVLEFRPCSAAACGSWSSWSIDSQFKTSVTSGWPTKIDLSIDIGEIVGGVVPSIMKGTGDADKKIFKLPNMFVTSRRRRLEIDAMLSERDTVTLHIPEGYLNTSYYRPLVRRLADKTWDFPAGTLIKSGSKCDLTYVGMPKSIVCTLKVGLGSDKVTVEMQAEMSLSYGPDGQELMIVGKVGFKIALGAETDYKSRRRLEKLASGSLLGKIDVGGLIDNSLTGTIKIMPFSFEFPKMYSAGKLHEVARIKAETLKASGMCISNMETLAPDNVKDVVKPLAQTLNKITGPVGGDVCGETPGLDLSNGFNLDVNVKLSVFDKSKVDVYPILLKLAELEPAVNTLMTIINSVMGDTIKTQLNDLVKSMLPKQVDFKISMGMLIAQALKIGTATSKNVFTGAADKLPTTVGSGRRLVRSHRGRLLETGNFITDEGNFKLGGIPASSRPGTAAVGTPITKILTDAEMVGSTTGDGGGGGANNEGSTTGDGGGGGANNELSGGSAGQNSTTTAATGLGVEVLVLIILLVLIAIAAVAWVYYRKTRKLPIKPTCKKETAVKIAPAPANIELNAVVPKAQVKETNAAEDI